MSNNHEYILTSNSELYHHGVKGMKWGVRRRRKLAAVEARRVKQLNRTEEAQRVRKMRAEAAVARAGGSKGRAIAKQIVKTEGINLAIGVGSSVVAKMLDSMGGNNVASAASKVVINAGALAAETALTVRGVKNVVNIAKNG